MSDISAKVERLETIRALEDLIYEYCHGMDRKELDRLLAIWTDDAVFITPHGAFKGKADIERGVTEVMWPTVERSHHWTVNFVPTIDGDRATSISNLSTQVASADGGALVVAATYHDEFERHDGRWLISKRDIEVHHFAPLPGVSFSAAAAHE